jgi:hypothetical protein
MDATRILLLADESGIERQAAQPLAAPFGALADREVRWLADHDGSPYDAMAILALRMCIDPRVGWCWYALDSLAPRALVSSRSLGRTMARLRTLGVVEERALDASWRPIVFRRVRLFAEWGDGGQANQGEGLSGNT